MFQSFHTRTVYLLFNIDLNLLEFNNKVNYKALGNLDKFNLMITIARINDIKKIFVYDRKKAPLVHHSKMSWRYVKQA
ncbi:hypothetical protein LPAF129_02980 [Ligilactobacillus pabuli]|uniref:Uncharacterized protein n=1 Tax=Ligilactobacillus pabuli TaxID=2886039 RepID=A0ABQ5JFY6_9LACO|nr:hypothetical protein LPAF129_02980 [Ligilactobacillus pabuli]